MRNGRESWIRKGKVTGSPFGSDSPWGGSPSSLGCSGIFDHGSQANPLKVFRLLIGLNIFNDAILVPVVLGLALAVHRWAPRWLLAPAQVWLIISGVVSLYAYPLVGDFGRKPSQPSELPFNYSHNLLIVLGCITLFCAGLALRSWRRERRRTA